MKKSGLKIWKIYKKVWVYSVGIMLLLMAAGRFGAARGTMIKSLLPVSGGQYWFITSYIFFAFSVPYIKRWTNHLTGRELIILVAGIEIFGAFTGLEMLNNCLVSALIVFLIQKNSEIIHSWKKSYTLIAFILFMYCGAMVDLAAFKIPFFNNSRVIFVQEAFYLMGNVSLFITFLNWNTGCINRVEGIIRYCAPHILAVYLITVHPAMAPVLYGFVAKNLPDSMGVFLVYFAAFTVFLCVICIMEDYVMTMLMDHIYDKIRKRIRNES